MVRGNAIAEPQDDAYLQMISGSPQLQLVREIALWWRAKGLEEYCVLTTRLLKRLGAFDRLVAGFFGQFGAFPYVEEQAYRFLEFAGEDRTDLKIPPLIASVAAFELALLRVKRGSVERYEVHWPCDPAPVIAALVNDEPLNLESSAGDFTTIISSTLPDCFEIHSGSAAFAQVHE